MKIENTLFKKHIERLQEPHICANIIIIPWRENQKEDGGEDVVEEDADGVDADVPLPRESLGRLKSKINHQQS